MADPTRHEWDMTSPPDDVDTVHDLLARVWDDSPAVSAGDRMRFETALIELASNVMRHADAGQGVSCTLTIDVTEDGIEARLRDNGRPGDIELSRIEMPDEEAESGRGLALIHSLVDEVEYRRAADENHWRIRKALGD
jgi:serine/threonine-protein kinase RsbW